MPLSSIYNALIVLLIFSIPYQIFAQDQASANSILQHLHHWLEQSSEQRPVLSTLKYAQEPLTRNVADLAKDLLWNDNLKNKRAKLRVGWAAKQFQHDDYVMKFEYKTFGDKPSDGRNLYISMHGGGNAPARVNDRQWDNQIGLYEPKEGIYLAPRAPTNEWNLWHLPHIDVLFDQIIQAAVVFEDVNPNQVYFMGYSAGGDGVYQLAPRMADRLAAAAMMAGHPNETVPLGLRNIGFTLHMGGEDAAYDRNIIAREWKIKLAELHQKDPDGYIHEVEIHEGKGHWMDREDQVAVEWMAKFTRNPHPKKVVWKQDDVTHPRFYWLAVDADNEKVGTLITASIDKQTIMIEEADGVESIIINLNDELLDLDQPVTVKYQNKVLYEDKINRNIKTIEQSLSERGDPELVYSGSIVVNLNN